MAPKSSEDSGKIIRRSRKERMNAIFWPAIFTVMRNINALINDGRHPERKEKRNRQIERIQFPLLRPKTKTNLFRKSDSTSSRIPIPHSVSASVTIRRGRASSSTISRTGKNLAKTLSLLIQKHTRMPKSLICGEGLKVER